MKEYYNAELLKELSEPFLLKELMAIVYEYSKYEMDEYKDIASGNSPQYPGITVHLHFEGEDDRIIRRKLEQRRYIFTEKDMSDGDKLYTDIKPACSLLKPFDIGDDPKWARLGLDRISKPLRAD
jgi:hypothetical protein